MPSPNNLPLQLTSFIGREREIGEVKRLLSTSRLLTLTGAGGSGKTRLALQTAYQLLDEYQGWVYFVNLAPITDNNLVVSAIGQTLSVKEVAGQPLIETLKAYLQDKELLLFLDNFEQVLEAAPFVVDLLLTAPSLKTVVTSREPLHVQGEQQFLVPPLSLPDPAHSADPVALSEYEAVMLFVQRAQTARADFKMTGDNALSIAEICIHLDGLPLAIELAAARISMLPPQAMISRLNSRLNLLTGGAHDLPARQQTLRNTIDWSYDLLTDDEKQLFRRLAVFMGGRTLQGVEEVCNADGRLVPDVEEGVESLLGKNLLRQRAGRTGEPRFWMLETIHEYAREKLLESADVEVLRKQHALYFMRLAEEAEPHLTGAKQQEWMDTLEDEHDNIRAVLRWARERQDAGKAVNVEDVEVGLRLAGALPGFWFVRGYYSEGRHWLLSALENAGYRVGEASSGERVAPSTLAKALHGLGQLADSQGDYSYARSLLEESLAISRRVGDRQLIAHTLNWLAVSMEHLGEYEEARVFLEESLVLCKELDDRSGMGSALNNLGEVARVHRDYNTARGFYESCLSILWGSGTKWQIATALHNLACIACDQDDYGRAEPLFMQSLGFYRELGLKGGIAACLAGLAGVWGAKGQPERAARLFGAAERLNREIRVLVDPSDRPSLERGVAAARSQIDEASFEAAWAQGAALALDEVLLLATQTAPDSKGADAALIPLPQPPTDMVPLTRREVEVLRLLVQALSNEQIAQRLFLSRNTVTSHLYSIYGKLDVGSRSAAARFAVEHKLV